MLNVEQVTQYLKKGYIALPELLPVAALDGIRAAALRIIDDFDVDACRSVFTTRDRDRGRDKYFMDSAESVHCFLEEEALDANSKLVKPKAQAINKIGHAMHDLVPEFTDFCRRSEFAELLDDLGHIQAQLWQSMYIFKQPRIGGEVRWHQDATYLNCGLARLTGMWVALEDATEENGCLWVSPGEHRSPLREIYRVNHDDGSGQLSQLDVTPWPDKNKAVPVPLPAGSVIVFDGMMPHYSSSNRSAKSRHAFTLHFTDLDAPWSADNWLQRPTLSPFLV